MAQNLTRIGKVSSIDYPRGVARVTFEDKDSATSAEFAFLAWEYWMPKIGDQVLVAHLSSGTSAAVIVGPVWHDGHKPAEGAEGLYRKEYSVNAGEAYERYDNKAKEYTESITGSETVKVTEYWELQAGSATVRVEKSGTVTITAPSGVTITAPTVTMSGNLTVKGAITAQGDVAANTSISLATHTHISAAPGSPTSTPQ